MKLGPVEIKLVKNAGQIAWKSHSMLGYHLTGVFLLAPELIYWFLEVDTNPRIWWFAAIVAWIYGALGRVVDQGLSR